VHLGLSAKEHYNEKRSLSLLQNTYMNYLRTDESDHMWDQHHGKTIANKHTKRFITALKHFQKLLATEIAHFVVKFKEVLNDKIKAMFKYDAAHSKGV